MEQRDDFVLFDVKASGRGNLRKSSPRRRKRKSAKSVNKAGKFDRYINLNATLASI
jgi:hypothetical protein